jgi:hypothetical protein
VIGDPTYRYMRRVIIGGAAIFTFVGGIYATQWYQSSKRAPIATQVDNLPSGDYGPYFTRQQSRTIFDREAATYQVPRDHFHFDAINPWHMFDPSHMHAHVNDD